MDVRKTVLVADENVVERQLLTHMLEEQYDVCQAADGAEVLKRLRRPGAEVCAVLLSMGLREPDGFSVLERIACTPALNHLPVLAFSQDGSREAEQRTLRAGAWDFLTPPYSADIVRIRLQNAVERSGVTAARELRYLSQFDSLTGLYNAPHFFEAVRTLLIVRPKPPYVMLRFDIVRFQLVNTFFGVAEGDRLLRYLAESIRTLMADFEFYAYGHMEADVFLLFVPYEKKRTMELLNALRAKLKAYNTNYDVVPAIGLYVAEDLTVTPEQMYSCATLACKKIKGNYENGYAFYTSSMRDTLIREQEITNEMSAALESGQFIFYLQPKYDLQTGRPCGAEALARWQHPKRGLLPPGDFIPLFERNGFITRMDQALWEQVCRQLRIWLDEGRSPRPISVNVSRVDLYNPHLYDELTKLVERYRIPPALLNLELTESAYTDNPTALHEVMDRLQRYGFSVMMDDFGSGYSSLNLLKEISVDYLKIDMRFLLRGGVQGRSENILASVVRMAKWIGIPVIAEGVETEEQADFLRSLGCDYAQGYHYAKPMPVEAYERLVQEDTAREETAQANAEAAGRRFPAVPDAQKASGGTREFSALTLDEFWTPNAQVNLLFNSLVSAVGIYELHNEQLELIRVNDGFFHTTGEMPEHFGSISQHILDVVLPEDRAEVMRVFHRALCERSAAVEGAYRRRRVNGELVWLRLRVKYICTAGDRHLFYGALEDITAQKRAELAAERHAARYRVLAEKMDMMLFDYDLGTGTMEYSAPDAEGKLRIITIEQYLAYLPHSEVIHPDDRAGVVEMMRVCTNAGTVGAYGTYEYRANFNGTGMKRYRAQYVTTRGEDGLVCRVTGRLEEVPEDAGALPHDEQQKVEQYNALRTALHAENSAVWEWEIERGTALQLVHSSHEDRAVRTFTHFPECLFEKGYYHPDSVEEARRMVQRVLTGEKRVHAVLCVSGIDGWWWEDITYTVRTSAAGKPLRAVGLGRDVTLQHNRELQLTDACERDPLTGLYNRAALEQKMAAFLENPQARGALLLVDLDDFKRANDENGHMYGDAVLMAVGEILRGVARKSDLVARFGGDEFGVFLCGVNSADIARERGQAVCEAFRENAGATGVEFALACSVGAALAPEHGVSFTALYENADRALYRAKRAGKDQCCVCGEKETQRIGK